MSVASPSAVTADRTALIRQAFRLEYITLAWMTVEAVVAIGSGVAVGSLTLLAFGIDSLIELASAAVLVWRLNVELRHGQAFAETAERTASRIGGALLFALAAYVVASAGWKLWMRQGAEFSLPGFIITVLAIPVMYFLSRRKLQVAEALGSRAMQRMPSRASPAAGSPSSSWLHSWPNSSRAPGGWTRWLHSGLSGSSSAKAARLGKGKIVATTANDT
jgi:hypothetical protein